MRTSKYLFFLTAAIVLTVWGGCASQTVVQETRTGVTDSEILVGSSAALGGHVSFLGTQYLHGSMAYINEINKNGGVHGREVKIISYDDQYDPPITVRNTQKLVNEDGVFALFDYVGTPTSAKIIDIVYEARIPALGFLTGAETLRTPYRPYMFHVRDSYYAEAEGAVAYFVDKLGFTQIGVVYQEDDFGLAVLSGVQLAMASRNLEPVVTATFERGTMDVEKALRSIKAKNVEAVILVGTYSPLTEFIRMCCEQEFMPYFHTVSFVGPEIFGKMLIDVHNFSTHPNDLEKVIVTQVVPSPFDASLPGIQEYLDLFKRYYPDDEPRFVSLEGFINAKVLVKALEDAGRDLTRQNFIAALEELKNFDIGIGKNITYDVLDHKGLEGIFYSRLEPNGHFRIFTP
jgi:ABC-type branched-subunit amino acid transport system substrate-binding protein